MSQVKFTEEQKLKYRERYQKPLSQFIKEVENKHGKGIYDFAKVNYVNRDIAVDVVCKKHNYTFSIKPSYFLTTSRGCPECRKDENVIKYLTKHKEYHKNELYDYKDYYKDGDKLFIKCKKHDNYFNIKHLN